MERSRSRRSSSPSRCTPYGADGDVRRWQKSLNNAAGQSPEPRIECSPMAPDVGSAREAMPNMLATTAPPVVAVVNQKGGVGKTTTAINLAAAMAEVGHSALLVDLDPQANSTSGLGLDPARARLSSYHLLSGEATLEQVIQPTGRSEEHTSELQSRENLVCR